ncbi:ankyrin repeat domain-containing protein (plasmid) [Paenibacillus cellulosilyticus]|nr:ankyrin repeat domain-containing protein [Paenibacillus cellulosilyticus]
MVTNRGELPNMYTVGLRMDLLMAIKHKDLEALYPLLDSGIDLNPPSMEGTYLSWAWGKFGSYDFDIVKRLIAHGAALNDATYPAIICAAGRGKLDELAYVVERGADVNAVDEAGHSALWHAVYGECAKEVQWLIEAGLKLDRHGEQALQLAASIGHLAIVKLIIERGVHCDARTVGDADRSYTPLHQAVMYGHEETAAYLLELGANPALYNDFGQNAYDLAKLNKLPAMMLLVQRYE